MSGDNMILLTPSFAKSILGIRGNDPKSMRLNVLRHLVKQCTSSEVEDSDVAPVQKLVSEEDDHINVLLSIITAVTDCLALGVTEDDDIIISDLLQGKRPVHPFFSQVCKKLDNGLPVEVLATFCDVAVVKFFGRCNAYSSCYAVEWCLQYLLKMFSALDPILQRTGSGWYNAKMKDRKTSSISRAPILPFSVTQVGGAEASGDQKEQPRRRRSGCLDHNTVMNMSQLSNNTNMSLLTNPSGAETTTLENHIPPVALHASNRNKRTTYRPPSMVTITEEPPDIISSNTIEVSAVRFPPDLTEPCNYGNNPLVCMPLPDSQPSSPTESISEAEDSYRKKSVRFEGESGEVDLVEYELQSGISCEGRIGLIAILNAIAKLPVKMTSVVCDERNSRTHNTSSLWNKTVCERVFKLIQKCMNSSMFTEQDSEVEDTGDDAGSSASYKRKAYRLCRTKPKHNVQHKNLLASYCGHVMHFAFQALIQCALLIRCSAKSFCLKQRVEYADLSKELHEKLSKICAHSGTGFKKYLQNFVKDEPVEKVLAFLHATLGFCTSADDDDELGHRYEHKVKIVVSVLKNLIEKIMDLDLTESSIKVGIVQEACRLVTYSLDLLSEETFKFVDHEHHISQELKRYILYPQRLVLSSVSPVIQNIRDINRTLGNSDDDFVYSPTGLRLWNNLPIDELKVHVERFVVIMHLSEPGSIPSAGLLASIIDMTALPVLVRAAVLFECAIFVNQIRNGWFPANLEVNHERCKNVLINFKHWGEAIGSKLEEFESDEERMKEEEPVLPREASRGYYRVAFSLKMMACQLLAEITYLLRDPPPRYNPYIPSANSVTSTTQNTPRPSNIMLPTDYSHSDYDDTVTVAATTTTTTTTTTTAVREHTRSSAGSLEPGFIHSRSNSLDVPRNLLIPSDQGSDTSGGEEIHKKPITLDTPTIPMDIIPSPITPTSRFPTNLLIPPATPDPVPSIVIASPTTHQQQRRMSRRGSLPHAHANKLKPLSGSFDKQAPNATSPTSYLHRKLSTFKDSFRKVRSVALKNSSRKSAVTKVSSPLLTRRKSISTPMSRAGSHKSLCDDTLCSNLPWLNVVAKIYHRDILQDGTLPTSYKTSCAELEGALRRLYTLPPPHNANDDSGEDKHHYTLSLGTDDTGFPHSFSMSHREKTSSMSSSSSYASSGTFSLHRFSRGSMIFPFPFGRRQSQLTHRDTMTVPENRVITSPNKSMLYTEELFGDNIEGAIERHAIMLQSRRVKDSDKRKIKYLSMEVKGLLHTPFTILQLALAANLIDATKIIAIRDICWDLLLDNNQELVQSAAMTFLWTVEKSKTLEFNGFFNQNVVIESSISTKLESITRYMVLWRNRHNCSLNEKDALRRLKMKNTSIGYALPSPLLGIPLSDIPLAPWESYTVCSADNCEEYPARCHKPTRLVPKLYHLKELRSLSQSFFISEISVAKKSAQEWLRSPTDTDSAGATVATDATNVSTNSQTALFPSSLLCFLQFLIDSVTITDSACEPRPPVYPGITESTRVPCTSVSDAARTALWTCMVEDHQLFFQPFLECFKRDNMTKPKYNEFPVDLTNHQQLENVLHSLRCLLIALPTLPPEAAQYLFNHLIAVIMQHKLQPYNCSNVVISEVLVLLRQVATHVQGLDCKVLKNVLKKEKCYNTVMTTANLQAVQGKNFFVKVKCATDHHLPTISHSFSVSATMTFRDLTSMAIKKFRSSMPDLYKWDNCILIDDSTRTQVVPIRTKNTDSRDRGQPMLDDLFIQDHYYSSVRDNQSEDNRYIVFRLQPCNKADKTSFERRSLFWYKMGEISRVVFSVRMLVAGSYNNAKVSSTSLPHYEFMHSELSELGSFPRKALDNILNLNGMMSPSIELRITDIMLKGVWLYFIYTLFEEMPENYAWSHEIILFISVVTGSLFLYADDTIILTGCLATLLLAAVKFNDIFRQRGYNTVVPVLAQVYTLHHHNKIVLRAIEYIWGKFYLLNDNVFVMQAVTSLAALLCSRTSNLEGNTQLNIAKPADSFVSDFSTDDVHQRAQSVKAIFQLIKSLRHDRPDLLNIEARIQRPIVRQTSQPHPQSPTSSTQQEFLYIVFDLCIAVAGAHPDSLRGMQMMVFLDHHMLLFLHEFDQLNGSHVDKWNKHIIGIRALVKGAENLIKVFRMQQRKGATSAPTAAGPITTVIQQESNTAPAGGGPPLASTFASLLQRLARLNTAIKSAMTKHEEEIDDHEGYRRDLMDAHWKRTCISSLCLLSLCSKFVYHLTQPLRRSFSRYPNTVQMLAELFNSEVKLLTTLSCEKNPLENRGMTLFMTHFLPSLSWAEERSLYLTFTSVLKMLGKLFRKYHTDPPGKETWDMIVKWMGGITSCLTACELAVSQSKTVKTFIDSITGNGLPADIHVSENYLESWPWEFSKSVVSMVHQMISHGIDSFSNYLTDVIEGKSLFIKTILIPFCIEYGQHDCLKSPKLMHDILEIIESNLRTAKQVHHEMHALRAFALSFADQIELVEWHRISLLLTSVVQKKCAIPCLTTTLHAPVSTRSFKLSLETLNSVIEFCSPLLSRYQTSLGLLMKGLLTQVESKLQLLQSLCTQESMMSELAKVIDNCRSIKSHSPLIKQFSKTALLSKLEHELITEVDSDCNPKIPASLSETAKTKFSKKKRSRLRANPSFKGDVPLELIKEDVTDAERCSSVERLSVSTNEQHRRSPRRMMRRRNTSDSESNYDDDDDNDDVIKEVLLPENRNVPPTGVTRKRTRTVKSRLMALRNQATEDYDGDYEDEIPTPAAVSFDASDKVFGYAAASRPTTLVEVHHSLKRSRSSDSSVDTSNDNTYLIPTNKVATSSARKTSSDQHSVSSPNIMFSIMDPLRHGNNSLKQLKVLLKGHGSYESTV